MKNIIVILCMLLGVLSCSKNNDSSSEEKQNVKPEAASLEFPLANSECVGGEIVNTSKSKITFKWRLAKNADEYELKLKNLETAATTGYKTANTELTITLDRGTAYSWYIISLNASSAEKNQSEIWKFYNAGVGVSSYAPFPADDVEPVTGAEVAYRSDGITLKWSGNDVDNDILEYDIYLGETSTPVLYKENITTDNVENVSVNMNTRYYWKVKTIDKQGNVSYSDVFQFKVN